MKDDARVSAQAIEVDSVPPRREGTCVCQRCGAMIDVEYRYGNGGKTLVVEPRRDIKLALVHKPEALDGARACGGRMSLMLPSGSRTPKSISQDEPLPYVDDAEVRRLRELVDLLDQGALPRRYVQYYRMRARGIANTSIAKSQGISQSAISVALSKGDKIILERARANEIPSEWHRAIMDERGD